MRIVRPQTYTQTRIDGRPSRIVGQEAEIQSFIFLGPQGRTGTQSADALDVQCTSARPLPRKGTFGITGPTSAAWGEATFVVRALLELPPLAATRPPAAASKGMHWGQSGGWGLRQQSPAQLRSSRSRPHGHTARLEPALHGQRRRRPPPPPLPLPLPPPPPPLPPPPRVQEVRKGKKGRKAGRIFLRRKEQQQQQQQ